MAKDAVKTLDVERYRELGPAFARAMEEVRRKTFLKRLNYSWAFQGDVFRYNLTFLRRSAAGAVDWLRPTELIETVQRIKSTSFDLTVSTVYDTLKPLVPRGAALLCTRQMWRCLPQDAAFLSVVWPIRRVYPRRLLTYVPGVALLRISKTALATLFMSSTTRSMKGYLL